MITNYLIIIINYNNWQDTIECIDSLKNSGIKDRNILLIDNHSKNNSFNELHIRFSSLKIIKSEQNVGFSGGNNLGIRYAIQRNYDYAILLNNDTVVESEDSIKILLDMMEINSDITLSTGRIFYYPNRDFIWYDGGKLIKWRASAFHYNYGRHKKLIKLNDNLYKTDFISGCFLCIRLRDISKLGYLDEKFFMYLEDTEYSIRAIKRNLKLMYVPNAIIYHKAVGEEKRSAQAIYYSIRNRRLLINLHFGFLQKLYFGIVLFIKKTVWFFTKRNYYNIIIHANKDYKNNYFGPAPKFVK